MHKFSLKWKGHVYVRKWILSSAIQYCQLSLCIFKVTFAGAWNVGGQWANVLVCIRECGRQRCNSEHGVNRKLLYGDWELVTIPWDILLPICWQGLFKIVVISRMMKFQTFSLGLKIVCETLCRHKDESKREVHRQQQKERNSHWNWRVWLISNIIYNIWVVSNRQ